MRYRWKFVATQQLIVELHASVDHSVMVGLSLAAGINNLCTDVFVVGFCVCLCVHVQCSC